MQFKVDLSDRRFGRLLVQRFVGVRKRRQFWACQCDCGEHVEIRTDQLTRGVAKSCGCLQRDVAAKLSRSRISDETINLRLRRARREAKGLPSNLAVRDLTGRRFGLLKVIKFVRVQGQASFWKCRCDCGKMTIVRSYHLNNGHTKSCGCFSQDNPAHLRHGHTRNRRHSSEYMAWSSMKTRCLNPNNKRWKDYGGRGITICTRWLESFEAFFADMGPKPSRRHSIDRKNNNGNYNKRNCRWATPEQQNRNRNFGGQRRRGAGYTASSRIMYQRLTPSAIKRPENRRGLPAPQQYQTIRYSR